MKTYSSIHTYSNGTTYGQPSAPTVASRPQKPVLSICRASSSLVDLSVRRMRGARLIVFLRSTSGRRGGLECRLTAASGLDWRQGPVRTIRAYQFPWGCRAVRGTMRGGGWADLYAWQVERTSAIPLFQQVYLQIRSAIVSRTLAPGLRLPSSRAHP